jgi:hypothetical protein
MVAMIGLTPAFIAVNVGSVLPLPLAASPIDVVLFFHVKLVDATGLLKFIAPVVTGVPLQYIFGVIAFTEGVGRTVILNV